LLARKFLRITFLTAVDMGSTAIAVVQETILDSLQGLSLLGASRERNKSEEASLLVVGVVI
jgi:hypothetical protein